LFSAGIGGIYIAMHVYGDMPLVLALLATLLFAAFWAILPALAGYVQARIPVINGLGITLVMPAVWALLEWFRGLLVTGFPWLTLGYSHSDTPLAGYAPVFGVYAGNGHQFGIVGVVVRESVEQTQTHPTFRGR
jgi:apolipoprotein N-acyltransferase